MFTPTHRTPHIYALPPNIAAGEMWQQSCPLHTRGNGTRLVTEHTHEEKLSVQQSRLEPGAPLC